MSATGGVQAAANSLAADDTVVQLRRSCRYCHRDRPIVPIGCSRWWDTCARCARGLSNVQRRYGLTAPDEAVMPIDPWAERVAEILETAERGAA
jgi:hypothetical protein